MAGREAPLRRVRHQPLRAAQRGRDPPRRPRRPSRSRRVDPSRPGTALTSTATTGLMRRRIRGPCSVRPGQNCQPTSAGDDIETLQQPEMLNKVLAWVSAEPSESACFGGFHVVRRQAPEYVVDVQSGQLAGQFGHYCRSEKGWRGVEAVMDPGMIKELDIATWVSRDAPPEELDTRTLDRHALTEPDQAPDRPVEIHRVLHGWIPIGVAVRRRLRSRTALSQVLRGHPCELLGQCHTVK